VSYAEAVDELYQAPHDAFVSERRRLVAALKAEGDKTGAEKLAKAPRPTASAWVVDQLWWHARDLFEAMFATAAQLRAGEFRTMPAHRETIAQLRARAKKILDDAGHGSSEAVLRRVTTTLSALAIDGGFGEDRPGTLAADRESPGFAAVGLGPQAAHAAHGQSRPDVGADAGGSLGDTLPDLDPGPYGDLGPAGGGVIHDPAPPSGSGFHQELGPAGPGNTMPPPFSTRPRTRTPTTRSDLRLDLDPAEEHAAAQKRAEDAARAAAAAAAAAVAAKAAAEAAAAAAEAERRAREQEMARRAAERSRLEAELRAARAELTLAERDIKRLEGELAAAHDSVEDRRALVQELVVQLAESEPA
jgi:hypothetical protein